MKIIDADAFEKYAWGNPDIEVDGEPYISPSTVQNFAADHPITIDPPNEPLTWDELGTMIEKPVYIVEMENGKSYWALVYTVGDTGTLFASAIDLNDYGSRELYGKSWLAYRHPPEGDEDT